MLSQDKMKKKSEWKFELVKSSVDREHRYKKLARVTKKNI